MQSNHYHAALAQGGGKKGCVQGRTGRGGGRGGEEQQRQPQHQQQGNHHHKALGQGAGGGGWGSPQPTPLIHGPPESLTAFLSPSFPPPPSPLPHRPLFLPAAPSHSVAPSAPASAPPSCAPCLPSCLPSPLRPPPPPIVPSSYLQHLHITWHPLPKPPPLPRLPLASLPAFLSPPFPVPISLHLDLPPHLTCNTFT